MKNLLIATLLAISASATAYADGWYLAADAGQTQFRDFSCANAAAGATCSNTSFAVRVAGGYQFTPLWGAEVSYASLGKVSSSGPLTLGTAQVLDFKSTAVQLAGTATLPINDDFAVLARIGAITSRATSTVSVSGAGVPSSVSLSATKTGFAYGFGGLYNVNKNIAIRLQYEDLGNVGDAASTGFKSGLRLLSAGLIYRFN